MGLALKIQLYACSKSFRIKPFHFLSSQCIEFVNALVSETCNTLQIKVFFARLMNESLKELTLEIKIILTVVTDYTRVHEE